MYQYFSGEHVYGDDVYTPEEYMGERWWFIDGAPGYMISDQGRVWSEKSQWFLTPKKMDREGHMGVCLYINGHCKYEYIHRLMAKAFIPNPDDLPYVRHLNDVPNCNELWNFAWGTQADNIADAKRNGRTYTADPEVKDKALESLRIPIMATNIDTGEKTRFRSQTEAAKELGLQQANIWKVLNGQRAHTCRYYFEYLDREVN